MKCSRHKGGYRKTVNRTRNTRLRNDLNQAFTIHMLWAATVSHFLMLVRSITTQCSSASVLTRCSTLKASSHLLRLMKIRRLNELSDRIMKEMPTEYQDIRIVLRISQGN